MARVPLVLVADRSRLASNLYKLIFAPLGINLLLRRSCEQALDYLKKGGAADLLIVSSNSVGPEGSSLIERLSSVSSDRGIAKIFICRESSSDDGLRLMFASIPGSILLKRPFHPDEMLGLVRGCLKGGAA